MNSEKVPILNASSSGEITIKSESQKSTGNVDDRILTKRVFAWELLVIILNFIALLFSVIVMVLSRKIIAQDEFRDLSIYDQGITDWTSGAWLDFTWAMDKTCPVGYSALGNYWPGTQEGYERDG